MRRKDEDAMRLLMEKYSAKERSLIGSERLMYFFGNLPLPPRKRRRNHTEGDALADHAAKMWNAVEGCVDAGRQQRVSLLYCVKRVTPLLGGCVAGDLGCKCTVGGKLVVEEAEEL